MQGARRFLPRLQDIGHLPASAASLLRGKRKFDETIELTGQEKARRSWGFGLDVPGSTGKLKLRLVYVASVTNYPQRGTA